MAINGDVTVEPEPTELEIDCAEKTKEKGWDPKCDYAQVCQMVEAYNNSPDKKHKKHAISPGRKATAEQIPDPVARAAQNAAHKAYAASIRVYKREFKKLVNELKGKNPAGYMDDPKIVKQFNTTCEHERWKKGRADATPPGDPPGSATPSGERPFGINPDHQHPVGQGGPPDGALKWANADVNQTVGPAMDRQVPDASGTGKESPQKFKAKKSCNCP